MNVKRVVTWSLAIYLSGLVLGLAAAYAFGRGPAFTLLGYPVRFSTLVVLLSNSLLYFFYVKGASHSRVLHVAAAFLIVEIVDKVVPLILGATLPQVLSLGATLRHLGAATLGLVVAQRLRVGDGMGPSPLDR